MAITKLSTTLQSVVVACSAFAWSLAVAGPLEAYDLDAPGALETLKQARPEHYAKIQRLMAEVLRRPLETGSGWLQTAYGAQDVRFDPILLTSDPPQRQLSFTLDEVAYRAVLRLTAIKPRAIPATTR